MDTVPGCLLQDEKINNSSDPIFNLYLKEDRLT